MSRLKLTTLLSYLTVYQRELIILAARLLIIFLLDKRKLPHIVKQFRLAPSDFLHLKSFYSQDDYFNDIKD